MGAPHDDPTVAELVESVREWLERDVMPATDGRLSFHARVAANVLKIVERELESDDEHATRHRERLALLGVADDADLADAIRTGRLDQRLDETREVVFRSVIDKLSVANPGYMRPPA